MIDNIFNYCIELGLDPVKVDKTIYVDFSQPALASVIKNFISNISYIGREETRSRKINKIQIGGISIVDKIGLEFDTASCMWKKVSMVENSAIAS